MAMINNYKQSSFCADYLDSPFHPITTFISFMESKSQSKSYLFFLMRKPRHKKIQYFFQNPVRGQC